MSLDSWWISHQFSAQLEELGFDKQVICGKSHLILETEQSRQALGVHRKQIELPGGWGQKRAARRLRGMAYLLALALWGPPVQTLAQLKHWLHRQGTFMGLVQEHFHPKGWGIA